MEHMGKRERLQATIHGEPVDRVAVAAWRHQPADDQAAATFAAATLAFQREYDFDFVKVTPASSYCIRDWGAVDIWLGHPHGTRKYGPRLIQRPDDWAKLTLLDPREGQLGEILQALRLIHEELGEETPFIHTIFSPIVQASNLVGPENLRVHFRRYPDVVKAALQSITAQTLRFVEAARDTGISGIFYAVQWASYLSLSEAEYREFGRPYDLQILSTTEDLWLNVLHLHGDEVMFDLILDYPAAVLNWHDRQSGPSLAEGLEKWPKAVCGGLRQEETLVRGTSSQVRTQALDAIAATGGQRLILGTGCVVPIVAPHGNLQVMREVVETAPR